MTMSFIFDNCNCVLEYSDNSKGQTESNYLRTIQQCKTHAIYSGKELAKKCLEDNRKINAKYFPIGTKFTDSLEFKSDTKKLHLEKIKLKQDSGIKEKLL